MKWQTKRYGRIPNAEKRENVAWLVEYSQRLWFKLQLINLSHVLFAANAIFQNSLHHLNRNRYWQISLTLRSAFQLSRLFPARTKNSWWMRWRVIDRKRLVLNKGSGSLKKINLYYRFEQFTYIPFFRLSAYHGNGSYIKQELCFTLTHVPYQSG